MLHLCRRYLNCPKIKLKALNPPKASNKVLKKRYKTHTPSRVKKLFLIILKQASWVQKITINCLKLLLMRLLWLNLLTDLLDQVNLLSQYHSWALSNSFLTRSLLQQCLTSITSINLMALRKGISKGCLSLELLNRAPMQHQRFST